LNKKLKVIKEIKMTIITRLKSKFAKIVYYSIAINLPEFFKGTKIRYSLAKVMFKEIGNDVLIRKGVVFGNGANIKIGDFSKIGINCRIQCAATLTIGNYVGIASDVQIIDVNHNFADTNIPIFTQGYLEPSPIVIEDDVWIGARAIILPGVTIGKGSIIGAAAVVTKDIPPYSIVGGNPAKIIKSRI